MIPGAQVRSIRALEELKAEFTRFASEALAALQAAEQEVGRALEWLAERERHWRGEVQRRQAEVRRAEMALERCRASGFIDRDGRAHPQNCSAYERALHEAQRALQAAEKELRNVQEWVRSVEQAATAYRSQAQRLNRQLQEALPKATARLGRKIGHLHAYARLSPGSGPRPSFDVPLTSHVGRVASTGGDAFRSHWLPEELGWQERSLGRSHHGFARAFTAPDLPLVALESQVRQGDVGSGPAAVPQRPVAERVARLVSDLGAEDPPAVVVAQAETGLADVYYREIGGAAWQRLREGLSLEEALRPVILLNEPMERSRTRDGET